MSFPKYPKYKNSGVGWLGDVPEHWEVCALKRIVGLRSGESIGPDEIQAAGEYPVYGGNGLRGFTKAFTHDGHYALIGRQGALCGNVNYATGKFWASEHAVVVSPLRHVETVWLGEMLRAMNLNQYSVSAAQPGLSVEVIRNLLTVRPPDAEQLAISKFLKCEIAKIDALVAEQHRLIELLKEKRQVVISHSVTKGLSPHTPMKATGIEGLGEMPAHWQVLPLKRDIAFITSGSRGWASNYSDSGALFIRIANLTRDTLRVDLSDVQRVSVPDDAEGTRTKVQSGDVLFSITAYLGSVAVVPETLEDAYVSQHVALVRLRGNLLIPKWLGFVALSMAGKTWFDTQSYGGTKIQLSLDDIRDFPVLVPPIREQIAIGRFIESSLSQLDALLEQSRLTINLLEERRTAVISAAVTGQIDVRQLAEKQAAA
jgi:type I restriction enzyme, S subunit